VKIVAKQQDSKQKTKINKAILLVPQVFIAAISNTKHNPRYAPSKYLAWPPGSSSSQR